MHSKLIQKITAPNASMFTGGGTNTYLIGKEEITIVDPGPNIETHINEIANAVGEKATRIWKIKKINENNNLIKYEGSAEDVEGLATGTSVGNALNWTYEIYLNIKGSNLKVKFNDWIYKQDSNVAINRAYVSKFGIDIGSVTLVFLKGQTAKTVSPLNINSW